MGIAAPAPWPGSRLVDVDKYGQGVVYLGGGRIQRFKPGLKSTMVKGDTRCRALMYKAFSLPSLGIL